MATATLKKPWLDDADWTPQQPDPRTLDARRMEFVFDADLDELTILYYGKERRHSVHPMSALTSVLIDPFTGETVGAMYSQFLKTIVRDDPRTAMVLMFAAILAHGHLTEPIAQGLDRIPERHAGMWQRVTRAYDALRGAGAHSISEQKIQSLGLLPTPC